VRTQTCFSPETIWAMLLGAPLTMTGVCDGVALVVPLPSCPTSLAPQQLTTPSDETAQECEPPAVTRVCPAGKLGTGVGIEILI
jgi:hypothetical protein